MLAPFREQLDQMKIILGSTSPRRKELLSPIFNFEVVGGTFDESTISPDQFSSPSEFVREQAKRKCEELIEQHQDADIIITADTVVFIDGQVLGKPLTHERAYEMLKLLNNKAHSVETGVFVTMPKRKKSVSFSVETKVYFGDLSDEVIRAYANTPDPLDKAGGYGLQSGAMTLVSKIDGEYANVIGLPVHALCVEMVKLLKE
jgi:septum formation protein